MAVKADVFFYPDARVANCSKIGSFLYQVSTDGKPVVAFYEDCEGALAAAGSSTASEDLKRVLGDFSSFLVHHTQAAFVQCGNQIDDRAVADALAGRFPYNIRAMNFETWPNDKMLDELAKVGHPTSVQVSPITAA